jgi:hypothetical protein
MRRSGRLLLSYVLPSCKHAAAERQLGACAAGVTASSSATTQTNGIRQLTSSAMHRSSVLPRLLDTLSDTYQQSKQRMDGLLEQMTAELEKVCSQHMLFQSRPCNCLVENVLYTNHDCCAIASLLM